MQINQEVKDEEILSPTEKDSGITVIKLGAAPVKKGKKERS